MFRFGLALVLTAPLFAADWLSASADPRHTRSQLAEQELSSQTARDLKLLWQLRFEDRLTAPVVLGPIFTHRGIKELVFAAGADNNLYAMDADLGRLFWKRHFETANSDCETGLTAAPVLAPYYGPAPEGDDASTPRRSLFVLTGDGQLHTVRPADAHDLALPEDFLPPGAQASDLTLAGNVILTYVSGGCTQPGPGEYAHRLKMGGLKIAVRPGPQDPKAALWDGYRIESNRESLSATRGENQVWSIPNLSAPVPPVTANGIVFTVSGSTLLAFSADTGRQLYRSQPNGLEPARDSLAIANGHIYFVAGNTIYCYGFPIEIE